MFGLVKRQRTKCNLSFSQHTGQKEKAPLPSKAVTPAVDLISRGLHSRDMGSYTGRQRKMLEKNGGASQGSRMKCRNIRKKQNQRKKGGVRCPMDSGRGQKDANL